MTLSTELWSNRYKQVHSKDYAKICILSITDTKMYIQKIMPKCIFWHNIHLCIGSIIAQIKMNALHRFRISIGDRYCQHQLSKSFENMQHSWHLIILCLAALVIRDSHPSRTSAVYSFAGWVYFRYEIVQ